jgi:hypothetical protein
MKITKEDRHRKEDPVDGKANVMSEKLDEFADKHPDSEQ